VGKVALLFFFVTAQTRELKGCRGFYPPSGSEVCLIYIILPSFPLEWVRGNSYSTDYKVIVTKKNFWQDVKPKLVVLYTQHN
jgi:hypothetical protein